jgi:hypothetical protein
VTCILFIMRRLLSLLPAAALLPAALLAQQMVTVSGAPGPEIRPFGKYLVQICTLSDGAPQSLKCDRPPQPAPGPFPPPPATYQVPASIDKPAQTITVKQAGCAPNSNPCPAPVYPLPNGQPFFVSATSDSGLPVTQHVVSGNVTPRDATPQNATGTQQYVVHGPGTIVIRASVEAVPANQANIDRYAAATPVDLILTVAPAASDSTSPPCSVIFGAQKASQIQPQIDLPGIVGLMGTPTPFVLTPQGKNTIMIYSIRFPLDPAEEAVLRTLPSNIAALAGQMAAALGVTVGPVKPFSVELAIPHAAALGDLATRISGLNYSGLTVQDIGSDRVRISSPTQPDCDTWTAFLTAIRHMEWQVTPEPFDLKLFYLSSTDAATAFAALAPAPSASSPAPAGAAGGGAAGGGTTGGTVAGTAAGATAGTATVAINQPPGSVVQLMSDTTPCVIAGLTSSNSSACAPASGGAAAASPSSTAPAGAAAAPAPKPPPGMAAMGVAAGTIEQIPSDLLVFSDTNPGDDAQILERKRILAQLDLPRPEMVINAWVMQNSTGNPRAMGMFSNTVRNLVAGYNDAINVVVLNGWQSVKQQTQSGNYFNREFYSYIADHYVADTNLTSVPSSAQEAAQRFLDTSPAKLADSPETRTSEFGICPVGRYCLGYNSLFHPLKPRLTDFLLTLVAANDPVTATMTAIREVEGDVNPVLDERQCEGPAFGSRGIRDLHDRCRAIWSNLGLDRELRPVGSNCASKDYREILGSLPIVDGNRPRPRIFLACFQQATQYYQPAFGHLRAAIADFLYNYKMSQQYPHEFVPYDLSQSADALNTALSPLIDAFNRDIVAYQTFMRADVQYQVDRLNNDSDQRCCVKRLFGLDKPSFFNDGIVTVRTISGQPTSVGANTQSVLDASAAPTLSNLLSGIGAPAGSATAGASPLAGVLGAPQSGVSLLAGVLNAYQSAYAQIGRSLTLQVTPRSLSTASSAEIAVTLNADEMAGGPIYSGGPQGGAAPTTSRVANHDIATRVRVESVKLFEVSSFSAIVQRSRSRFPLLPPFVEIPYIGTIAGIPIPGAKEYHSSTAVMSAMVIPTAADLAYGLRFVFDQVVDGDAGSCSYIKGSAGPGVANACRFRRAVSMVDLNKAPIGAFHKAMINCLATEMTSPYASAASLTNTDTGACKNLSFDRVPQNAY